MKAQVSPGLVALAVMLMPATTAMPTQAQTFTVSAQTRTYTLLHTFTNVPDGAEPLDALIRDADGTLYGTTAGGGILCSSNPPATCGAVFEVDSDGDETVLYRFKGGEDGAGPLAGLVRDASGNLYGTTEGNGVINAVSTVFKVDSSGHETVLHIFNNFTGGGSADAAPVLDAAGNLYGTTPVGGDVNCGFNGNGCGVVYKVDSAGKFSVVHTFTSISDGFQPEGDLVLDQNGNLYGTTEWGDSCPLVPQRGCGTVFRLSKNGKYTVLHRFSGKADGAIPPTGLTLGTDGNLYGVTNNGGDLKCNAPYGCGTIFELGVDGKLTVRFTFTPNIIRTASFLTRPVRDSKGNLYGDKWFDGAHNNGFVYKVDPSGKFTDLYDFPPAGTTQDGDFPQGLVMDAAGNFYSTMAEGGDPNQPVGTVFKLAP